MSARAAKADGAPADPQAADAETAARLAEAADRSGRDPLGLAPTRVVVIGGGAAGLTAARDCARPGFAVTLVEARERTGGSVARVTVDGLEVDAGAESFATRGGAVAELIRELGLAGEVVTPNSAGAWLHLTDRTVPMSAGGILGIPSTPLAADVIRAIGWRGALRAYLDRLMPVMSVGQVTNLGRLVRRRMGRAVLDRLVSPVTTGVYSAAADDLDVGVVAPGLNGALTRTGSLSGAVGELLDIRAAARSRGGVGDAASAGSGGQKPGSAVGGLRGGMATLTDALAADLRARGGEVRLGTRVTAVRPGLDVPDVPDSDAPDTNALPTDAPDPDAPPVDRPAEADPAAPPGETAATGEEASAPPDAEPPARWLVELEDGESIPADAVLVALPGEAALAVLATASEEAAALAGLDWPASTGVEIVTLVLDAPALDAAPRGTGLLVAEDAHRAPDDARALAAAVARGEVPADGRVTAKALTHSTAKWPWLAERAGAHRHVLRLSYGRAGHPGDTAQLSDDELSDLALRDAAVLLDIPLTASMRRGFARTRWTNAQPSAALGQRERIRRVREAVAALPGFEVAGAWAAGTGLASVVPDAREAARRIRGLRWKALTEHRDDGEEVHGR